MRYALLLKFPHNSDFFDRGAAAAGSSAIVTRIHAIALTTLIPFGDPERMGEGSATSATGYASSICFNVHLVL